MRPSTRLVAVPLLALLLLAAPRGPSAAAAEEGHLHAVVSVRGDPTIVAWPEVHALLAADAPGVQADVARMTAEGEAVLGARVVLRGPADRLAAELDARVKRLEQHVGQEQSRALSDQGARRQGLQRGLEDAEQQIADVRERMLAGSPEVTAAVMLPDQLLARRLDVQTRLDDALLDQRTLAVRRANLEQRLQATPPSSPPPDLVQAWEQVLAARTQAVTSLRAAYEAGNLDPLDLAAAQEALARARLERADALAAAAAVPTERRKVLEDALADLAADAVVLETSVAHLREVAARLDQALREGRQASVGLTALERERDLLRDLLTESRRRTEDLLAPPRVTVLRLP